jgi:S1-C subfamily serine protease
MPLRRSFGRISLVFIAGAIVGAVAFRHTDRSTNDARRKRTPDTVALAGDLGYEPAVDDSIAPPTIAPGATAPDVLGEAIRASLSIRAGRSFGSGVLVAPGLALTAYHVVEGERSIEARFPDSDWVTTIVRSVDARVDLALLAISSGDRPPAVLGSVAPLRPGDDVRAIGNPRELAFSVSRGIVSYAGRERGGLHYLQTDLATNPGSSGAPVVDADGRVVAFMSFVLRERRGIAFAIPVDYAIALFSDTLVGAPPVAPWVATDLGGAPTSADHSASASP